MTRIAPVTDWSDPQDPTVLAALQLKCACGAKPGQTCTSILPDYPLQRVVHHVRIEVGG